MRSVASFFAGGVDAEQDEQQDGETPECGASITEEGERNAYDRA